MSAAAAVEEAAPAPKRGKKKLILILVAVLLVLGLGGGGAAFWLMKKKAAEAAAAAEADGEADTSAKKKDHDKPTGPPTFLPLEAFVVNLADRDVDRFAQIGITLEVTDAKAGDQLKQYMPAIRDGILMILAHKQSTELLERAGKEKLAAEVLEASLAPLPTPDKGAEPQVRKVHFSSFIIQ
jgi:flagellar FliL protein